MVRFTVAAAAALALVAPVLAHPGEAHSEEHMKREIAKRDLIASMGARSLGGCANSEAAMKMKRRSVQRRADTVKSLRRKRGIDGTPHKYRRDLAALEAWEEVNHNMTGEYDYDMFTSLEDVFSANTSCILAPEVTAGPYYVVGEYMRSNVKESLYSDGVDLFLEVQYVDIETCEPIPDVAVDVWNANATGVYSGVDSTGEGGLNSTFLRGIQLTDHEGVVQFETIFPGHYSGRAIHTHLLSHTNATLELNGTISVYDSTVAHIGQLFYPEALREAVEANEPYASNTVDVTTNDEDMWSIVQADDSYDPFPEFLYLGDSVEDGLFVWIQIGLNTSANYASDDYYAVAGYFDASGGHSTGSSVGGGSSGGEGGENGTAPSGSFSGSMPSGTASPF